jgi:predicted ATP-binding protein involved in virulence
MDLRLDELRLQNYRCFGECVVTFHKNLTVLIADNGGGKTAILDGAAVAVGQVVDELTEKRQSKGILKSDVRMVPGSDRVSMPQTPTRLDATGTVNGEEVEWACERKRHEQMNRWSRKAIARLVPLVAAAKSALSADMHAVQPTRLPLVVYYGSTRFSHNGYFGGKRRPKTPELTGRMDSYRDYLDPLFDSTRFNSWYEERVNSVRSHVPTGAVRDSSPFQHLAAIRAAVKRVLEPTGWAEVDWDSTQRCVVVEHPNQGRLPLATLSSGVRNMVALTADIAYRCVRLNPFLGEEAARSTPGVVLVDEVDLHLHPSWQQRVVGLLREAFPEVQFILSTHSPQVLSTVDADSIRVVNVADGMGQAQKPRLQTRGVESADILAKVMEVYPVPQVEEAKWLSEYRALVEKGQHQTTAAADLWERLTGHFGVILLWPRWTCRKPSSDQAWPFSVATQPSSKPTVHR